MRTIIVLRAVGQFPTCRQEALLITSGVLRAHDKTEDSHTTRCPGSGRLPKHARYVSDWRRP